jgi:hypothetical protein
MQKPIISDSIFTTTLEFKKTAIIGYGAYSRLLRRHLKKSYHRCDQDSFFFSEVSDFSVFASSFLGALFCTPFAAF